MWLILLGLIVLPERFAEACDAVLWKYQEFRVLGASG
jgi:hypothetical protein